MWADRQTDGRTFRGYWSLPAIALLKRLKNELCLLGPICRDLWIEDMYDLSCLRDDYTEPVFLKEQFHSSCKTSSLL
jgi:hypothetical protein